MESLEIQLNKALEQVKTLTVENTSLKEAVSAGKVATAKAEREGQLKESKLPAPCVTRINEAFAKSTDNAGLKEAINAESEYVKSLRGTVIKHNGSDDNASVDLNESETKIEELRKRQYKVYRESGMSKEEAASMSGYDKKDKK